jgi:xanthine dehydrogenase molybdopterin-binding subunit B
MPLEHRIIGQVLVQFERDGGTFEGKVFDGSLFVAFRLLACVDAKERITVLTDVSDEALAGHRDTVHFQE